MSAPVGRAAEASEERSSRTPCVMIVAGEASGDLHAARVVRAMRRSREPLFFCGIGGPALRSEGVRILADAGTLAVVGITEALLKAPVLLSGLATAKRLLRGLRPDLLILVDFPDFNLHIAATARKLGIPVLYYISPQVWAWRSGRLKKIRKRIDRMAVILPFEADYYRDRQIPVTFVGHPLLDAGESPVPAASGEGAEASSRIGLLPGSRPGEIARCLPAMAKAAGLLLRESPHLTFPVSVAPGIDPDLIRRIVREAGEADRFPLFSGKTRDIFHRCGMVIAVSGTVTLEAAIAGIPMVIVYRLSPISYVLGKILARVRHFGLVNLIAGESVVPELLQGAATPEAIADTVSGMLRDPARLDRMRRELLGVKGRLGSPGASGRVAEIALDMLNGDR